MLREEIGERIWGRDVVLDIDNALNTAIRKVRHVLRDNPAHARYVETVPAKGYRFIGVVTSASRPEVGSKTLHQTNLPIQPSPLVGRERELADVGRLIGSHRLVTLTGPGGSGKTRLAIQLAAEAAEQFPDGVFWVPLQALRDPALVEQAIRAAVGADGDLIAHVASKRLLVLLDNFEQVVEAAPVVSSLLAGTPNAKVLITSRAPLHLDPERRYPVEPLPEHEAAILFVARASAIAPEFRPTAAVGEICRRLDGLPLAIELAAAHVALLEPDELLARLGRRLPLLTSRSRNAPARQRTLHATIEWSYELLDPNEQQLFRRVAVFTGSFSLEAAEAVCDSNLDTLESLVEKSLVRRWGGGRLGMLDTTRPSATQSRLHLTVVLVMPLPTKFAQHG